MEGGLGGAQGRGVGRREERNETNARDHTTNCFLVSPSLPPSGATGLGQGSHAHDHMASLMMHPARVVRPGASPFLARPSPRRRASNPAAPTSSPAAPRPSARRPLARPPAAAASAAASASKFWVEAATPSTRHADALAASSSVILASDASATPRPATSFVATPPPSRTLLVVARSLGCPFCQNLARGLVDILPDLDAAGVPLYLVSIGVPEKARAFCELTGFPPGRLLADPTASVYGALDLERGVGAAFLSPTTPAAIGSEIAGGGGASLAASLRAWVPYLPPKPLVHALAQGGTFGFSGNVCVFARADRATADHLSPAKIREVGLGLPMACVG